MKEDTSEMDSLPPTNVFPATARSVSLPNGASQADSVAVAKVHLAACLSLVRPVSMSDAAAMEWINVAAVELTRFPPSVIEQACSAAKRNCGHHAKILPFVAEECERLETDFARMREAATAIPLSRREPERRRMSFSEILDNERWLNTPGEAQARMRGLGLSMGTLIEEGGQVRYASDLR